MSNENTEAPKRTVLVIEDEAFILDLLVYKFKDQDWKIVSAMNGEAGIEKAKEEKPDIILLDILMPGMNGYEVLEQLKSDESMKDIPVLVLSNYGQKGEIEKSKELGAVDHLVKANIIIEEVINRAEKILSE